LDVKVDGLADWLEVLFMARKIVTLLVVRGGGGGLWPYSSAGRMMLFCTSRPKIELIKCSQNRELTWTLGE